MNESSFNFDQFNNKNNPESYKLKAKQIFNQFGSKLDCIILPLGSGGSITGIAKEYKKYNPSIITKE